MQRARIIIKGDVQKVGFRGFVIDQMKSLKLNGYAENLPTGEVEVVCEGSKDKIENLIAKIKETPPHFAKIDSAKPEWQDYIGNLKEPERRGEDVPKKGANLDDVVKVLTRMDMKLQVGNERLGSIDKKQDKMLDKQDQTIEILGGKIDNVSSKIDSFHQDTVQRFDKLDNSFTSFHQDTIQRFDNLDRKYGKIAENMEKILEEMKEERKEFRKFTERIISMLLSEKSKSKDLLRKS